MVRSLIEDSDKEELEILVGEHSQASSKNTQTKSPCLKLPAAEAMCLETESEFDRAHFNFSICLALFPSLL